MSAFSNFGDIFKMLKNAGPLGEKVEEMRAKVARLRVTGEAGAGIVKVTVNGDGKVVDCKIDSNLLSPDEFGMLEDLFISATNDAIEKSKQAVAHELQSMTGIPDMNDLFGGGGV